MHSVWLDLLHNSMCQHNQHQGCVTLGSGCRHYSSRFLLSALRYRQTVHCNICKQTWLLLLTNAGTAVALSVCGPVSTILLQLLSVFHSCF